MDTPLNRIRPAEGLSVLVFVKMPKTDPSSPEERKLLHEWIQLEKWLAFDQFKRLTETPPMLFDNVWHFAESRDETILNELLKFLQENVSTFKICLIHGRLENYM
jgi:hypothetical protein